MPDPAKTAALEVGAILSAPGRGPASGPARILIADGRIASIEPQDGPGNGTIAIAAPVNAHDHGRGLRTLAFGAVDDALEAWIPTLGREPKLHAYRRAVVAFARMAEGGICATNHSHGPQDEANILGEAQAVSRAARDVGIHVAFAAPFTDRNPLVYGEQATFLAAAEPDLRPRLEARLGPPKDVRAFLASVDAMAEFEHANFSLQYCPVGAQWVSEASLAAIAEASALNGRRIHMHLLETRYQREWADHAYPDGMLRRFDELGLLSPRLSVAHGVYLTEDESALLAARGVVVSVNTSSNFRLRSGLAPLNVWEKKGITVGMGLDEAGINEDRDMLQELKLALRVHRTPGMDDDVPTPTQIFRMASEGGAKTTAFGASIGRLDPGRFFDAVLIDIDAAFYPYQDADIPMLDALVQRAHSRHVSTVYVDGEVVYADGRFTKVDRDAVLKEIHDRLAKPRSADELARRQLGLDVFPHVKSFYEGYIRDEPRKPFYEASSSI